MTHVPQVPILREPQLGSSASTAERRTPGLQNSADDQDIVVQARSRTRSFILGLRAISFVASAGALLWAREAVLLGNWSGAAAALFGSGALAWIAWCPASTDIRHVRLRGDVIRIRRSSGWLGLRERSVDIACGHVESLEVRDARLMRPGRDDREVVLRVSGEGRKRGLSSLRLSTVTHTGLDGFVAEFEARAPEKVEHVGRSAGPAPSARLVAIMLVLVTALVVGLLMFARSGK